MARGAIRKVPGFRTGRWWKAAIAICGYAFLGLMAVVGMATMFPIFTALALGGLAVVLLAFGAGGVRQRTPGLNSRNPLIAAGAWLAVLGLILAASIATDSVVLSPETRAARDARSARTAAESARLAAERAAREAAAKAAASTPTPTAAPTAAPSPTATPSPAATPSPTAAPTATPSPTAAPTATPTPTPTRNSSLALSLTATIVSTDTAVRATASLREVTPTAGGSMRYAVYNDSACASGPAVDAGTKPVVNGSVVPSDAISFENAGAAYWRATYTGDGDSPSLSSACLLLTVTLPPPVAYQVVERKDVSFAGRKRISVSALIPGQPTKGQKIATLAAIARDELRSFDVMTVFAWRSLEDRSTCLTYTIGGAELSADGRGWAAGQNRGGATTRYGPDNGQVQGEVELLPLDRFGCPTKWEQFTAPR